MTLQLSRKMLKFSVKYRQLLLQPEVEMRKIKIEKNFFKDMWVLFWGSPMYNRVHVKKLLKAE